MTQAVTSKLYNTFVGGLITEASPLTFPANTSFNESNCLLYRKGNRTRRPGVDYETNAVVGFSQNDMTQTAVSEHKWEAVGNYSDITFLAMQVGRYIFFWDMAYDTLSSAPKSFSVDLGQFVAPTYNTWLVEQDRVQFAHGKGYLFVVGQYIEPFYVAYNRDIDNILSTQIYITIRDFIGVDDGLANDEEPTSLSNLHLYNLQNQGWLDPSTEGSFTDQSQYGYSAPGTGNINPGLIGSYNIAGYTQYATAPGTSPIKTYFNKFQRYPPNSKQWWIAKATAPQDGVQAGDFDPTLLNKVFGGNAICPRGHYVVNAFKLDRTYVSGVPNLNVQVTVQRPASVAFYAGRVWYVCQDTVYFSQVIDDIAKAGMCYQVADPTCETISDLVATDGGNIPIPEMTRGVKLIASGSGVVCFGENGIWMVTGTQAGFRATDYAVIRLSQIGVEAPQSVVEAGNEIYYWSKSGIERLTPDGSALITMDGGFKRDNISQNTVQTFVMGVPDRGKMYMKGLYDTNTQVIQWWYNSQGNSTNQEFFDSALCLDLTLQAFYPWQVSSTTATPWVCGLFQTPRINQLQTSFNITAGGVQVTSGTDNVTTDQFTTQIKETFMKYVYAVPDGSGNYNFTFGIFSNDTQFTDWQTFDPAKIGFPYMSFIESGYEILGDAMRRKQAVYVTTLFGRIENALVLQADGGYQPDILGSCYFQTKWDWADTSTSNKWSSKVQAYRVIHMPKFDPSNLTFDNGYSVIVTKNKVRGSGKALQFRFESDAIGSNFNLLGWAVFYSGSSKP